MENKPLRFRAAPEVHAAAATLQARGVDVGEMLSKHLIEQARPKPAIYEYALRMGMETRLFEAIDFDGLLVKVVTNGKGEKWAIREWEGRTPSSVCGSHSDPLYKKGPRYILLFRIDHRGLISASTGVVSRSGGEQLPAFTAFPGMAMRTPKDDIPLVSPDRAIYDAEVLARANEDAAELAFSCRDCGNTWQTKAVVDGSPVLWTRCGACNSNSVAGKWVR